MNYTILEFIFCIILSFMFGSVPFGLILTKFFSNDDLRNIGSGNVGATNVFRTGKKWLALLTLICDALKGFISYKISFFILSHPTGPINYEFINAPSLFAALFSIAGHIYSPWLKFKGGKGIATFLGVIVSIKTIYILYFAIPWMIIIFATNFASVASLSSVLISTVFIFYDYWKYHEGDFLIFTIGLLFSTLIIFLAHKENIQRLLQGKENKISWNRKKS